MDVDTYYYTLTLYDDYGNHINDNVQFTIYDTIDPVFVQTPNNRTLEAGYTGQSLSWNVTDASSDYFIVELLGGGIVQTSTPWESGVNTYFNIPDGLAIGQYEYRANFYDQGVNVISDIVKVTIEDTTNPVFMTHSGDISITVGYGDTTIYWIYVDESPSTYTVELVETGLTIGPLAWTSETQINYNIPQGLQAGVYTFNITVTDVSGNSATHIITVTINSATPGGGIPFGDTYLLFTIISIVVLYITSKRRIFSKSD